MLSAEAVGAPETVGLPGAVAVELIHNFSLLHDDVLDGDLERRHRPTVWAVWGMPTAILAGDTLLALAHEIVLEADGPGNAAACHLLAQVTRELTRGQTQDLAFEKRDDVTLDECLDMAGGKTGSLLAAAASIGAILAGADETKVAALKTFGAQFGLAFQLVDDVLGIWGDPAVTGKSVHSDLQSRKKSLPVTYAWTHAAHGPRIRDWFTTDGAPDSDDIAAMAGPAGRRRGPGLGAGRSGAPDGLGGRCAAQRGTEPASARRHDRTCQIRGGARLMTQTINRPRTQPAERDRGAAATLSRAVSYLRGIQHAEGYWKGELATNVTMDAEDLLLREFLGHPYRRGDRGDGALDPLPAARRRHLGDVRRRPAGAVHHGRGLGGAAAGR